MKKDLAVISLVVCFGVSVMTGCNKKNVEVLQNNIQQEIATPLDTSFNDEDARTLEFKKGENGKYVISDWYDYSSKKVKATQESDIRGFSVKRFDKNVYDAVGVTAIYDRNVVIKNPIVLERGESYQLKTKVNDIETTDLLKFSINGDSKVATVSTSGLITFKADGQTSVLITANGMSIEIPVYSKNTYTDTEEYYKNILKAYTSRSVEDIVIDDFDNDGKREAFVFTASSSYNEVREMNEYNGEVWFINKDKVERLTEDKKIIAYKNFINVIDIGNNKIIKVDSHHPTASVSYIWEMKNGSANIILDGKLFLNVDENNSVYTQSSAYDRDYSDGMWTGHTWKNYYFYIDNGIKEYGALEIGLKDFMEFEGSQAILDEIIKNKSEIVNILYRGNNIININVATADKNNSRSYYNYTLTYDEAGVKKIKEDEGIYRVALCPEVATYPEIFVKPNNKKDIKYKRVTEILGDKLFLSTSIEKNGEDYLIKGELVNKLTISKAYIDMKLKLKEKVYCADISDEIYEPQLVSYISGDETYVLGYPFNDEIRSLYSLYYNSATNSYDIKRNTEFTDVWNWDSPEYIEFIVDKDAYIQPYYDENLIAIKDFYLEGNHKGVFRVVFENGKCVNFSVEITGY